MHFVRSMPAFALLYALMFSHGMGAAEAPKPEIYLSENIKGGTQLRFSDGSVYEVAPQDRGTTQFWITPFSATFGPSTDTQYPVKITNTVSGTSVSAKKIG
ncbi:MAG: hypothetical protein JSR58_06580 [Verrucomicrobia bacterium]|nr:hypothetical protein [Verrucomicrobiota bacterium]